MGREKKSLPTFQARKRPSVSLPPVPGSIRNLFQTEYLLNLNVGKHWKFLNRNYLKCVSQNTGIHKMLHEKRSSVVKY